jgi:acetolactate synthase-1/2/3 large subunit
MTQEIHGIRRAYGEHPPQAAYDLMNFERVNLAKVAEAMGCFGVHVECPDEIRPALEQALACGRPAVVDVVTDPDALPPEPWAP